MTTDEAVRRRGPFTRADLEAMPDDGRRYEIIDGLLVASAEFGRRLVDLNVKKARFERAVTPSFWVVDPVAPPDEARLIAWELAANDEYQQVAEVRGESEFHAVRPFPVTVVPAILVR